MDLTPDILLYGYSIGIFPMAKSQDDPEIFWVDPDLRGVMPIERFHISKSLAKAMRKSNFTATVNRCFLDVVDGCANRKQTWINAEIRSLYHKLFQQGHAQSLEIWDNTALVGGVYGVSLGAAFFGESMFSTRSNASKIALACLCEMLGRGGYQLFDTQFLTPHLASLGAYEIPRASYQNRLGRAVKAPAEFLTPCAPYEVVQRKTHTS